MTNINDNKEDITLVWLDSNAKSNDEVETTKKQLYQINDHVLFHTEHEPCMTFIESAHNRRVLMVISTSDALQLLSRITHLPQIDGIFIFNWENIDHQISASEHPKLIGVYNVKDSLYSSIQEHIHFLSQNIQTFTFIDHEELLMSNLSRQTTDILWYQLYHDILLNLSRDEEAKREMIGAWREYCRSNIKESTEISRFENEYRSEEAVHWYFNQSYLYKIINESLRMKDFDQLHTLRYIMKDIVENIGRGRRKIVDSDKTSVRFYRAMTMTRTQIESFTVNKGRLVAMNGFLTASIHRAVALSRAMKPLKRTDDVVAVLLKIDCALNKAVDDCIGADYTYLEQPSSDGEVNVLFNLNVTFRIDNVKMQRKIWSIKMTESNAGQLIKEKYIKDSCYEIDNPSIEILFGRLMCDKGQWHQSRRFFESLLNKANITNEDAAKIQYSLGDVLQCECKWAEAQKRYEHAHELLRHAKAAQTKDLLHVLVQIGNVLYLDENFDDALKYYREVLEMAKACCSSSKVNEPLAAAPCQNNHAMSNSCMPFLPATTRLGNFFQERWTHYRSRKAREISAAQLVKLRANKAEHTSEELYQNASLDVRQNIRSMIGVDITEINNDFNVAIVRSLQGFGMIFRRQERYDEALILHQKTLEILEEYYRSPHIEITISLQQMAATLAAQHEYNLAIDYSQRAISICLQYYPTGHISTVSSLSTISYIHYCEGEFDEALKTSEQALAILQTYYPMDHISMDHCLLVIGYVHFRRKRYKEAYEFCARAMKLRQEYCAFSHDSVIGILRDLGYILTEEKRYTEALHAYREALEMLEKYYPSYSSRMAHILICMSSVFLCQSKYDEALPYCQKALALQESYYPSGHASMASSFNSIGWIFYNQCKYDEALDYFRRALAIAERYRLVHEFSISVYMNNIGATLSHQGQYTSSLEYHERALAIQMGACKVPHIDITGTLNWIGYVLWRQKKYEGAIKFYQQSLAIRLKHNSTGDAETASILHTLGSIYFEFARYDKSLSFYQKALAMLEKYSPDDHISITNCLFRIGIILGIRARMDAAIEYLKRCLLIRQISLPVNSELIIEVLSYLSLGYNHMGNYELALKYEQSCLLMRLRSLPPYDKDIGRSFSNIGHAYKNLNKSALALNYYKQALTIYTECLPDEQDSLSDVKQNIQQLSNELGIQIQEHA